MQAHPHSGKHEAEREEELTAWGKGDAILRRAQEYCGPLRVEVLPPTAGNTNGNASRSTCRASRVRTNVRATVRYAVAVHVLEFKDYVFSRADALVALPTDKEDVQSG
ncbi:hypothetical protein ACWD64_09125 [Streptomyces antibioticus]